MADLFPSRDERKGLGGNAERLRGVGKHTSDVEIGTHYPDERFHHNPLALSPSRKGMFADYIL